MRRFCLGLLISVVVLLPTMGNAQAFQFLTPAPDVSAAAAEWQINGTPIVVDGLTYYPTRGFRLFDGHVMAQTGMVEGVPVYSDTTIALFSEIYVPLSSGRMRVYERPRAGGLAGTTGSYTPTFPVESPSVPVRERNVTTPEAVGTAGTSVPRAASDNAVLAVRARPRPVAIGSARFLPGTPTGVWLDFAGAKWYSNGPAQSFSPDRFELMGEYHGFPVYRDKNAATSDIWVSVVKDGPLAPYARR